MAEVEKQEVNALYWEMIRLETQAMNAQKRFKAKARESGYKTFSLMNYDFLISPDVEVPEGLKTTELVEWIDSQPSGTVYCINYERD